MLGAHPSRSTGIRGRRLLMLVLLCSVFLIDVMGAASAIAAAPSVGQALRLSPEGLQWGLIAATLTASSLLMLGAYLADLVGRRPMVIAGLVGTMVSSFACGGAPGLAVFVTARAMLGASSALSFPAALALLTDTFSDERERRKAVAVWSAVGGVGSTAGMLLGGLVTAGLGWRWLFATNGIACLPLLLMAPLVLTEPSADRSRRSLDIRGLLYFSAGIGAVLYAVGEASSGRSLWPQLGPVAAGLGLLAGFTARQRRVHNPLLPPDFLRVRAVRSGNVTLLVAGMLVDGLLYALSLLLQDLRGYTALQYGAVAAVMTGSSVVAADLAQRLVGRFGAHRVAVAGLAGLALTATVLATSASPHIPIGALVAAMVLFGVAMGLAFVAGSIESLSVTDEGDNATAGALQNISFALGTALGVATVSAVAAFAGHLGAQPLDRSDPARLLTGLRAALWGEGGVALIGATTLVVDSLPRPGRRRRRRSSHPLPGSGSNHPTLARPPAGWLETGATGAHQRTALAITRPTASLWYTGYSWSPGEK